jgi:ABC-2 type transport system ATP-binding protein
MDGNKVLVLDDVSVRYRKQDSRSTADIIKRILGKSPRNNEFWALKNISFSLEKGDMLGVVGKNGAGKSTMMKAISGTLTPASGTIEKTGKICALLELGTGFDREMTVRENVYLRGAFMGYDKEFIDSKYDEIIDFAQMREFQNSPFRTLSSGMKSRIAFAIASMIQPDIIILDEIFAVGDGEFRKKSQQKMQSIIDDGDTTALMVSHSLQAVRSQCNKVLWLDKGRMVMFGDPNTVCDEYAKYLNTGKLPQTESLARTQENPHNKLRKNTGKRIATAAVYFTLMLAAIVGCFVWSQYDLLKSYLLAQSLTTEQITNEAANYHRQIDRLLGVDTIRWDEQIFTEGAQRIINDEATYTDIAKEVLLQAGDLSREQYKKALAAAEIEAIKYSHMARLDILVAQMREEFEAQPEGKYRSLMVYAYTNCDRFYDLEESCEDDLQEVIEEIRAFQRKAGESEELADQVWNAYKSEKSYLLAYYCVKLR